MGDSFVNVCFEKQLKLDRLDSENSPYFYKLHHIKESPTRSTLLHTTRVFLNSLCHLGLIKWYCTIVLMHKVFVLLMFNSKTLFVMEFQLILTFESLKK